MEAPVKARCLVMNDAPEHGCAGDRAPREAEVAAVCRIAEDWKGDATLAQLIAARYEPIRSLITEQHLARTLGRNGQLVRSWQHYCADKRTSGGWAIACDERWVVWQPFPEDGKARERRFDDEVAACAAFVRAELEYWRSVGQEHARGD